MDKNINAIVTIGYAEKVKKGDLDIENFPSKIGGNPIWLFPFKETNFNFNCEICKETMNFLCQLYAPLDKVSHSYHRYLYVFFCKVL